MKPRIVKKKVPDSVLAEIRRMIISGEFKEGDKLPNQNEFAAQLGVSRPSLREALQTLTQLGAIEQRPGVGTILVARSPALLAGNLELPLISDTEATLQLVEARRVIEMGMVSLAVTRASQEELAAIGQVLKEMERAAERGDVETYCTKDLIYHHLIAQAAHNRFLSSLFQNIRQPFEQFLTDAFSAIPHRMQRSLVEHRKIYEAMKTRDPGQALAAMNAHLDMIEQAMEVFYRQQKAPEE
ncbi:MAG: FadR family transcriptional regulator [Desulfarculus sp.]|nr:MAG: FadR family transcriptional regulator [Desulfarculus sp.]